MAKWLERESQGHETNCHELEVMGSNPGWVEYGLISSSVYVITELKIIITFFIDNLV